LGIACGDLNNDERDEVLITSQNLEIHYWDSTSFQRIILDSTNVNSDVFVEDMNNDGIRDIVTTTGLPWTSATNICIYKNDGDFIFEKVLDFTFSPGCNNSSVTDFNNDSLPDILLIDNTCTGCVIWYNQGNFFLADSQFVSIPNYGELERRVYCSDLDNNGFNDIVTIRSSGNVLPANVDIRFNDGAGNFGTDPIVGIKGNSGESNFSFKNYPNPFHSETVFEFELSEPSDVDIDIYDIYGNVIKSLSLECDHKGKQSLFWQTGNQLFYTGYLIAVLEINGMTVQKIKMIRY
jgi:hypothetical protein